MRISNTNKAPITALNRFAIALISLIQHQAAIAIFASFFLSTRNQQFLYRYIPLIARSFYRRLQAHHTIAAAYLTDRPHACAALLNYGQQHVYNVFLIPKIKFARAMTAVRQ